MYGPVNKSIISISGKITFGFWRVRRFISGKIISIDPARLLVFKILTYYYQNKSWLSATLQHLKYKQQKLRATVFVKDVLSMSAIRQCLKGLRYFEAEFLFHENSERKSLLIRNAYKTIKVRPKSNKIFQRGSFSYKSFLLVNKNRPDACYKT